MLNTICKFVLCCAPTAVLFAGAVPADGQEKGSPDDLKGEVSRLVDELTDDDFSVRQQAQRELISLGGDAVQHLKPYEKSGDLELRSQIKRTIKLLEIEEKKRLLKAFVESDDPDDSFGLDGWKAFSKYIGTEREQRKIFVDLHQKFPSSMKRLDGSEHTALDQEFSKVIRVDGFSNRVYQGINGDEDLKTLLLAVLIVMRQSELNADKSVYQSSVQQLLNWCSQEQFVRAFQGAGTLSDKVLKLIRKWVVKTGDNDRAVGSRLRAAIALKMDDGAMEISKICLKSTSISPSYRSQALVYIGMKGTKKDIELVEKMIGDKTQAQQVQVKDNSKSIRVLLGDVAFASMLQLTKQKPEDFDMIELYDYGMTNLYPLYGFDSDKERQSAKKKWAKFRENEKK